mmetsp:Transcript_44351/g.32374  ORF Transcript_44351/g.32374 Transcript_44351/m.32374 type:complete len:563 (+) Transcript_44351:1798-3486(+)
MQCIEDWINANSFYEYVVEGHTTHIYGDGSSKFPNGTQICTTGGEPCVDAYFANLKPKFEEHEVNGRTFEVYPNGTAIETTGGNRETVCTTGGIQCVYDLVYYDVYTVEPYTFHIYGNGKGTFANGTVVCATGGQPCIDDWLRNNLPYEVSANVDGTTHTFDVYEGTGKVVDQSNGKVICETGGEPCLEEYLASITPQNYEIKTGALTYNLKVYPDGRVTDANGKVLCATGGVECMNQWVADNVPTHHEHTNGQYYYIFPNGTVWDNDLNVVCETGGLQCLNTDPDIIFYEELVYTKTDGTHLVTLRLFENGAVDRADNFTVACETGGRACADQYVNDNYPEYYSFPVDQTGHFFEAHLFLNGTSKRLPDRATICELGNPTAIYSNQMQGIDCLTWYFYQFWPSSVPMEIGPFVWNFWLYEYGNGSSYRQEDWQLICSEGGEACLAAWGDSQKPTIHTDHRNGDKYYEFPTGEVYDAAGNMVCSEGGYTCLDNLINLVVLTQETPQMQSSSKLYIVSVIVFMAALYAAYALYKKQQEANEKRENTKVLRESLLSGNLKEHMI